MAKLRFDRTLLILIIASAVFIGMPRTSFGQSDERVPTVVDRAMDVDVEVELHILVASNSADSARLPSVLEGVAKELRPTLAYTNYRLGGSFLSRVKNGRPLNVRGVGRSLLVTPALESSVLPTFYEISASTLYLKKDSKDRAIVQIAGFRFGLRIPLQTALGPAREPGDSAARIQYESVGITTDITMREGEAIVVGTLDAGRPNETLVLVLIATRAYVGD